MDPCVFIAERLIVLTYVDDCIIMGKTEKEIKDLLTSLKEVNKAYDLQKKVISRIILELNSLGI